MRVELGLGAGEAAQPAVSAGRRQLHGLDRAVKSVAPPSSYAVLGKTSETSKEGLVQMAYSHVVDVAP